MKTNMTQFRKSRRPVRKGDVFTFEVKPFGTMCGWVITDDANVGVFADGPGNAYLIYLYKYFLRDSEIPASLGKEDLLVPPIICTREPWSEGCFVFRENRPVTGLDRYREHCFDLSFYQEGEYRTEYGKRVSRRIEPCGTYRLALLSGVDKRISDAFGIPHAQPD